jgi:hypothetical protein
MFHPAALEPRWFIDDRRCDMTLMHDYSVQILTDQRERELTELAYNDQQARRALNRKIQWRRLFPRRDADGTDLR